MSKLNIKVPDEIQEKEWRQRETEEKGMALSEKIATLILSESVTVDVAERALRRAEAIVRTRTVVNFIRP